MSGPSAASVWLQVAAVLVLTCLVGACSPRSAGSAWNVEGPIRAIDGRVWIVGDRLVTIASDARIVGAPEIGSVARIRGTRNERGSPIGLSVEITPAPQATTPPTATSAPPPTSPPQAPTATAPPAWPQAPVTAPPPATTVKPANQPKPQSGPGRDDDKDDDKDDKDDDKKEDDKREKEERERRGPSDKPGGELNPSGKPRGR